MSKLAVIVIVGVLLSFGVPHGASAQVVVNPPPGNTCSFIWANTWSGQGRSTVVLIDDFHKGTFVCQGTINEPPPSTPLVFDPVGFFGQACTLRITPAGRFSLVCIGH